MAKTFDGEPIFAERVHNFPFKPPKTVHRKRKEPGYTVAWAQVAKPPKPIGTIVAVSKDPEKGTNVYHVLLFKKNRKGHQRIVTCGGTEIICLD